MRPARVSNFYADAFALARWPLLAQLGGVVSLAICCSFSKLFCISPYAPVARIDWTKKGEPILNNLFIVTLVLKSARCETWFGGSSVGDLDGGNMVF